MTKKMERLRARVDAERKKRAESKAAEKEFLRQMRAEAAVETANKKRLETQRLCTLGRAWMSLSAKSERNQEFMQSFLSSYISRDTDRIALRGTLYAVDSVLSDEVSTENEHAETEPHEHHEAY